MVTIVQWEPVLALGYVLLEVRPGSECVAGSVANELSIVDQATVIAEVHIPGVNIRGGMVNVGDSGPDFVTITESAATDVLAAAQALASHIEPARFLITSGHAVTLDGQCHIEALTTSWIEYVEQTCATDVACRILLAAPIASSNNPRAYPPSADLLTQTEAAVRLCPDSFDAHFTSAWMLDALGRHAKAVAECERALALPATDVDRAMASDQLGHAHHELGAFAKAVEAYRAAAAHLGHPDVQRSLGVALMHAGSWDEAERLLRAQVGKSRLFVDVASALATLGERDVARSLLRFARWINPKLTDPVPDNQWPKPPELSWARALGLDDTSEAEEIRHG